MTDDAIDLLAIGRGSVTAPAGCGKTRLIANALQRHEGDKPALILTHTNAGVGALRSRLIEFGVPSSRYRLYTIDGWTIKVISTFPQLSGHSPTILHTNVDYPAARAAAANVLKRDTLQEILRASYSNLLVDEYQDCSIAQHEIIRRISESVPTAVLGDDMQAIFAFGGNKLVSWSDDVCGWFKPAGQLETPWRWINAGSEKLGYWLLSARKKLEAREPIDVSDVPGVTWICLKDPKDHDARREAAAHPAPHADGTVLVIGDSKNPSSQRELARSIFGGTAVESADLRDLVDFARIWDPEDPKAVNVLINFAATIMRQVDASGLKSRLVSLQENRAKIPANTIENSALQFIARPSNGAAAVIIEGLRKHSKAFPHRPILFRALVRALRSSDQTAENTLLHATLRERERNRLLGRPVEKRAVGSTLLLKGLEASTVIVIDAHLLDRKNLYVAMTRGSQSLVICSPTPVLVPK